MMALLRAQMQVNIYWYVLPLIAAVSLVYSATRHEQWGIILGRAVRLACLIAGFMGLIALGLWAVQIL